MMKVTVTAADSKAGVEIVRGLASAGFVVRSATRRPHPAAAGSRQEHVLIDFLRPDTLRPAFAEADAAVLIVPEDSMMVPMTDNLVAAAARAEVERLVLISFLHAGREAAGPVLTWHRKTEEIVGASPLAGTCLRPNYYMQDFLAAHQPAVSFGGGRVSYVDARDVGDVVAGVLSGPGHEGRTYSLTGPRALSVRDVAEELSRGEMTSGSSELGWEELCLPSRRSAHPFLVQALCDLWSAASEDRFATVTDDVERLTGHRPRDFAQFVRDHPGQCRPLRLPDRAGPRAAAH